MMSRSHDSTRCAALRARHNVARVRHTSTVLIWAGKVYDRAHGHA